MTPNDYAAACERAARTLEMVMGDCEVCAALDDDDVCLDCQTNVRNIPTLRALAAALRDGEELERGAMRGLGVVSIITIMLP